MASMEAVRVYDSHYWSDFFFFNDKPMLVDIMTAIIGPVGVCTGKPMQVEQMTAIIGRMRFFQWQAKSSLTIIGPIESCAARLASSPVQ